MPTRPAESPSPVWAKRQRRCREGVAKVPASLAQHLQRLREFWGCDELASSPSKRRGPLRKTVASRIELVDDIKVVGGIKHVALATQKRT